MKTWFIFTIVTLNVFGVSHEAQSANDLSEKYLNRPKDQIDLIDSSDTRKVINLNGFWRAKKKEDKLWTEVWVPGAYDFAGEVEFRRDFKIDSSLVGYAFKLIAFGINNRCKIFLNNEFIGGHEGGHTSFSIELAEQQLFVGEENKLRISVDNSLLPRSSLPLKNSPQIARNYGGIFRDIFIIAAPPISIDNLQINKTFSEEYKKCQLTLKADLKSNTRENENTEREPISLQVEVWDLDKQVRLARSYLSDLQWSKKVQKEIALDLKGFELWTPELPKLYELRISITQNGLVLDETNMEIGFNEIEIKDSRVLLNGQPFSLRGVDWYEDYPGVGPAAGWNTIKEEIQRVKDLGGNTIRVVGTPPHPYFLNICDEVGLLVLEEMPLTLIPELRFQESYFKHLALNYCKEMVERDAYHVSIAAWGLGSDWSFEQSDSQDFLNELIKIIGEHSPRPTYLGFRLRGLDLPPTINFAILDFYNRNAEELSHEILNLSLKKMEAIVLSCGYPLSFGRNESDSSHFSLSVDFQENQAYQLNRLLANPILQEKSAGVLIHTFADWKENQPNLMSSGALDGFTHTSGLMGLGRERRIAYDAVKSNFAANQPLRLTARLPGAQNPNSYPILGLAMILFFLFNFQRSRKLRGNLRRVFLYPHGFYMELKEKRKTPTLHTVLLSLMICLIQSIVLSSILFNYRESSFANNILNLLVDPVELKLRLMWLIWRPMWFIGIFTVIFYLAYCLVTLFLRIISSGLGVRLPVGQFFTLTFWSNANFIWLLPIMPIYFRIINQTSWTVAAISIWVLFFLWACLRFFRGLRVVYALSVFKAAVLAIILLAIVLGGIGWYYDVNHALFDYLPMYWQIAAQ